MPPGPINYKVMLERPKLGQTVFWASTASPVIFGGAQAVVVTVLQQDKETEQGAHACVAIGRAGGRH